MHLKCILHCTIHKLIPHNTINIYARLFVFKSITRRVFLAPVYKLCRAVELGLRSTCDKFYMLIARVITISSAYWRETGSRKLAAVADIRHFEPDTRDLHITSHGYLYVHALCVRTCSLAYISNKLTGHLIHLLLKLLGIAVFSIYLVRGLYNMSPMYAKVEKI